MRKVINFLDKVALRTIQFVLFPSCVFVLVAMVMDQKLVMSHEGMVLATVVSMIAFVAVIGIVTGIMNKIEYKRFRKMAWA